MKLIAANWPAVLRELPRWQSLTQPARYLVLTELKTTGFTQSVRFGDHLAEIVHSGIVDADATRSRVSLANACRDLLIVLRAMHRQPVFDFPEEPALLRYLEGNFTNAEIEPLLTGGGPGWHGYIDRHAFARRITFAGWPADLLDADSESAQAEWAMARGLRTMRQLPLDDAPPIRDVLGVLRRVLQRLLAFPDGIPVAELVVQVADDDATAQAHAIRLGLQTAVVFGGMRQVDLEPMIGLWPAAAWELVRPPLPPPPIVTVVEQFSLAVQMEDMTTVLTTIAAAPVRMRANDGSIFAKTQSDIQPRLVALPVWAIGHLTSPFNSRADAAARTLREHDFVDVRRVHGNWHYGATPAGMRWITLSAHDRLAELLTPLRKSKENNPDRGYESERHPYHFFPFEAPHFTATSGMNLRASLTKAFTRARDGFVDLAGFLEHATREENPFPHQATGAARTPRSPFGDDGRDPRDTHRAVWHEMLGQFLVFRLLHLGGAILGVQSDGALAFKISDAGGYLLGFGDEFGYGTEQTGDVVIQPNFDVVFMGANPGTEAVIARFAERVGAAPGLAFRITRKSVLASAEAGTTTAAVIDALTRASTRPVPQNVQREISGWMALVRHATLRTMQVIDCPDEDTAARVIALLGSKVRRLTPTLLEATAGTAAQQAALTKVLRTGGVFIAGAPDPVEKKVTIQRRRRSKPIGMDWDDE
jgi:hypothetical protein